MAKRPTPLSPTDLTHALFDLALCIADMAVKTGTADAVAAAAAKRGGPASALLAHALETVRAAPGLDTLPSAGTAD